MDAAFAPLKEICPDRATPELMELTARLGSLIPYRQAASVLAEFLPIEPTETHATVRKRTIKVGERLDDQIARESWCARRQLDERCQLEMQLPGDRRKEFVISIDTAHVRSADANSARNFEIVVARCGRGGRGDAGGRYFVTSNTDQHAIRDRALHALRRAGYCDFGDVTVISDGAEILKRLPRAMPKPTTHIIDWFHIAMKIQPMQQIADHMVRSRPDLAGALPSIDSDIRAVKWRLWHGRVDRAIRDLKASPGETEGYAGRRQVFDRTASQPRRAAADLCPFEPRCDHQLRQNAIEPVFASPPPLPNPRSIRWSPSGW